jgi:hypothetical protein
MTWRYVNKFSSTRVSVVPFVLSPFYYRNSFIPDTLSRFPIPSIFLSDVILSTPSHSHFHPQVLVSKLWSLLLKENVIPSPCEEDEEDESGREGGRDSGCELCARVMPLTRHHLRPRATHKKLLKQVRGEGGKDEDKCENDPSWAACYSPLLGNTHACAQGISQEELNICAAICRYAQGLWQAFTSFIS